MTEVVLIQGSFLTVVSKQKNRNNTRNTIASSYNSKVWSTQSIGVQFSPCLGHGKWYYIITCLGNGKVFADNSKLINLFDAQLFHENVKWIKCVSDMVYTLFKKRSLLFPTALWCNNCRVYHELRQGNFYSFDHDQKSSLPFKLFTSYPKEKSTPRIIMFTWFTNIRMLTDETISSILSVTE